MTTLLVAAAFGAFLAMLGAAYRTDPFTALGLWFDETPGIFWDLLQRGHQLSDDPGQTRLHATLRANERLAQQAMHRQRRFMLYVTHWQAAFDKERRVQRVQAIRS